MRSVANRLVRPAILLFGLAVAVGSFFGDGSRWLTASASSNPIVAENLLIGTPDVVEGDPTAGWDITGSGDANIQGFATEMSVNKGDVVHFKIDVNPAASVRLDIYRMGYYQGLGARKIGFVTVSSPPPQPSCGTDTATGLVDCGNWQETAQWPVPSTATSGIYFAKAVRTSGDAGSSHIFFVVRDDASTSDLVVKTSDTTWQAYNTYGAGGAGTGSSFYVGIPAGRGYKLSYNRPFDTRSNTNARSFVFSTEYPMVRWLESNGYDLSYISTTDLARGIGSDQQNPINPILQHKVFVSSGHDEYWSGEERANVEAARAAGKHLAFFSGNEMYWKTRWENSTDGSNTPYRTLVSYKETWADAKIDPTSTWTGTWRDPRFSPPADGGRPENAVSGQIWTVNCCVTDMKVAAADGKMRFWRNTSIASLPTGATATLAAATLGYEWDEDLDNGARPAGIVHMSTTSTVAPEHIIDYGNTFPPGLATHHLTLYRAASGALVFGAGTVQWAWGLDRNHDGDDFAPNAATGWPTPLDPEPYKVMQQATVNLLADMGVQAGTLQPGLAQTPASTDTLAPSSSITSPAAGFVVSSGNSITVTGTASDLGGGVVGGVEVSVDDGVTWHPAEGREEWSYIWTGGPVSPTTIRSRAVDDSGNLETPAPTVGVSGTVIAATIASCPCTIWKPSDTPGIASQNDTNAVEVGVKFRADADGYITGLRFYKGAGNTGTHIGHLWTAAGVPLAAATFTAETASGWQEVAMASPVAITRDTDYVASYHANSGQYAVNPVYFDQTGHDNGLLHAPRSTSSAGNGVFLYGVSGFPTQSFNAANYWVDVVFNGTLPPDTTPPVISDVGATPIDSTTAAIHWTTDELSNSQVAYGLSPSALTNSVPGPQNVVTVHSVTLTGLQPDATYYYQVTSADSALPNPNSSTAPTQPASFTLSSASLVDTTVADFSAGSRDANSYVGQTTDGELLLRPTEGQEFSGPGSALPAGWLSAAWTTGGSATVTGGQLVIDGARAGTVATYGPGRSLEFVATFSGQGYEHVGFGTFDNPPWAMFTTFQGGALYARTLGTEAPPTLIVGNYLNAPHLFRIDWNTESVVFSIDGAMVATHELSIDAPISPGGSDFYFGGGSVSVDWVRMSPYAASSTFISRVLDAGGQTTWGGLSWNSTTPAGTSVAMSVRTGNTPVPDGTWTAFAAVPLSGATIGGTSRYVQYFAVLATTDSMRTPVLSDVSIGHGFVTPPPDTTAPVISNITANPTSSYTSSAAVITWSTDELANSRVAYGTTPGALTGLVVDAAAVVAHSVAVTGLAPNTQYYYRVTSADASGNEATSPVSPATFTTPPLVPPTFIDTTFADFSAGTPGTTTYVTQTANGEVILAPAAGSEFSGSALESDWFSGAWSFAPGGSAVVGGGLLTLDGARASTLAGFGPGRSLEFVATFGGAAYQHVGFVKDFDFNPPWAVFGTNGTNDTLFARTLDANNNAINTPIPGPWLGAPHRYRIDWGATSVVFWIDGNQVATQSSAPLGPDLRPVISDAFAGGASLTVDWLHMTPYGATGTFVSRIFDAGAVSTWGSLSWTSDLPVGTSVVLSVRTGDTATADDGTWTGFTSIGQGAAIGRRSRYVQYQAVLSTTDIAVTPALQDVTIGFTGDALTNSAPIANDDSYTTNEDTPLSVPAPGVTGNDTDANGDPLTAALVGGGPEHGTLTLNANGSFTYAPDQDYNGPDAFTYKANDGEADSNVATVNLTIAAVNDAPTAGNDTYATNEDTELTVGVNGVLANDSDVDGTSLTAVLVNGPTHGSLSLNADGSFGYIPAPDFNGTDSFTYKANDGTADSNVATVTITVNAVNDSPVANAQSVSTPEDTPVAITLAGTDPENQTLTFAVASTPANGTLSGTAPNVTYTPNGNFNGSDSFTFTASDGALTSAPATVTINVAPVNDGPTATAQTVPATEDTPVAITLAGTDPENQSLTFVVGTPANGTLSGTAPTLTYTPNANYNGPDSFTFKVNDGTVDSTPTTVSITITAVNDAPVANAQSASTPEDTAKAITLTASDVDGNPLTYSVVTGPAQGSLSGTAPNLTYTPVLNYNGPDSFTFKVNDGTVDSTPATVSITVNAVNDAPTITNIIDQTTPTNTASGPLSFTVGDVETAAGSLTPSGTSSNLTLVPTANIVFGGSGASRTVTVTPAASQSGTATITVTVTDADGGTATDTFLLTVAPNNAPTAGAITWAVSVDPVKINTSITGTGTFADVDASDVHTATWDWGDGTTSAGTVAEAAKTVTGSHSYAAPKLYTVTLTVKDGAQATATSTFQHVVVIDPLAGYETGSGSFSSPAGAYIANPSLTGTASITSLYARYAADGTMNNLSNSFKFSYSPAIMTFTYTSMKWLVIDGNKTWLKGEGWNNVNGVSEACYFLVSVVDSTVVTPPDKLRVKIWSKTTPGKIIYDSQPGAADDALAIRAATTGPSTVVIRH